MRLTQNFLALCARRSKKARRALLLPIQSVVSARHLLPLAKLAHGMGIVVYYTLSKRTARTTEADRIHAAFNGYAHAINRTRAHSTRWALIVVADHGHFWPLLLNGSPVAHIGHGNPSKTDHGSPDLPWEYGHAPRTRQGHVAYHEMIEASDRVRDALVATDPTLAGRIKVLGRLLDDDMLLQHEQDQTAHLEKLGLDPARPVLLAVSTLRENSLFGRYWHALLPQLRVLANEYQVLLCPHPREYAQWSARLESSSTLRLLPAGIHTEQALSVAHMLITDYSSLCQKAALLNLPMVLARCDPRPVWSKGATRKLYAYWPVWDGHASLEQLIAQAKSMRDQAPTIEIIDWVNSRPCQARALYSTWLSQYFPETAAAIEEPSTQQQLAESEAAVVCHHDSSPSIPITQASRDREHERVRRP